MAIARTRRRRVYSHPERVMSHSSVEPLKSTRRITQHVRRNSAACPYQILGTSCGRCGCRPETDTAVRRHDRPGRSPPCPHVGFCPQLELAADVRALLCLRRERCSLIVRCPEFRSATAAPGDAPAPIVRKRWGCTWDRMLRVTGPNWQNHRRIRLDPILARAIQSSVLDALTTR
jgi:hypothetical protein